jgi:cystathionine beta-lyase
LFSVRFRREISTQQVHAFCDALQLFKLGFSWAGPMSLVVPYDLTQLRPAAAASGDAGSELVRFSIGLESADDLQADLAQALQRLSA